jgi:transposase
MESLMNMFLGIDISKSKFDVALLNDGKYKHKVFSNDNSGFKKLHEWLTSRNALDCHACLEATGVYGDDLAQYMYDNKIRVSVVNPLRIKKFAESELSRNKTDKADAKMIADFCRSKTEKLMSWKPALPHIKYLRLLVIRRNQLLESLQQEKNRLSTCEAMKASINSVITCLNAEIKKIDQQIQEAIDKNDDLKSKQILLDTIPGIGGVTIATMLAYFGETENFQSAKQIASFSGLSPKNLQSGSSVHGKTRVSKTGDANLRKALYMPAVVALRYNPVIKSFCARLTGYGKCKMVIVCAAMRKLLHIIYGVLKTKTPFRYQPCSSDSVVG